MTYTFIPGKPHPVGTEAETLSAVRSVLTEIEEETAKPRTLFGKQPRASKRSKAWVFAPLTESADSYAAQERLASLRHGTSPMALIRAKAASLPLPKRKHVTLAALALLVALKPFWILGFIGIVLLLIALAFMAIGGETIWRGVMLALHQLSEKDPERAVRIRRRLDRMAVKWDGFLDRLPEGSVDGLYMPDFQVLSAEEARNEARFVNRMERD